MKEDPGDPPKASWTAATPITPIGKTLMANRSGLTKKAFLNIRKDIPTHPMFDHTYCGGPIKLAKKRRRTSVNSDLDVKAEPTFDCTERVIKEEIVDNIEDYFMGHQERKPEVHDKAEMPPEPQKPGKTLARQYLGAPATDNNTPYFTCFAIERVKAFTAKDLRPFGIILLDKNDETYEDEETVKPEDESLSRNNPKLLADLKRVKYKNVSKSGLRVPEEVPCHLCYNAMRLCVRRCSYRQEMREYPAYRCLTKGCQTFRSFRKVVGGARIPVKKGKITEEVQPDQMRSRDAEEIQQSEAPRPNDVPIRVLRPVYTQPQDNYMAKMRKKPWWRFGELGSKGREKMDRMWNEWEILSKHLVGLSGPAPYDEKTVIEEYMREEEELPEEKKPQIIMKPASENH